MADDQEITEKQREFFTLLAAAVLIDGVEKPDERAELDALMLRTRTLSMLKQPAREKLYSEIIPALKRNFQAEITQWDLVDRACRILITLEAQHPGLCRAAYLHAVDLAHADRDLLTSEATYLTRLETAFNITDSTEARELIKSKNAY